MKTLILAVALPMLGQTARPSFEVASIKPNNSGSFGMQIMGGPATGGRFVARNVTVKQLVALAYRLQDFQIMGGPGWIATDHFDIEAKPESGGTPSPDQTQLMLQGLLEDRFQLKVRQETKDAPVYALVVAKGGPKMKLSADQTQPTPGPPPAGGGATMPRGAMRMGLGDFSGLAVPMSLFLRPLSQQLGRPVVDKTGLTGLYDVDLHWTPDQLPRNLPPGIQLPPVDPGGPSIFTAVQEQLGLRLESATGPVEAVVIERVEKPSEN